MTTFLPSVATTSTSTPSRFPTAKEIYAKQNSYHGTIIGHSDLLTNVQHSLRPSLAPKRSLLSTNPCAPALLQRGLPHRSNEPSEPKAGPVMSPTQQNPTRLSLFLGKERVGYVVPTSTVSVTRPSIPFSFAGVPRKEIVALHYRSTESNRPCSIKKKIISRPPFPTKERRSRKRTALQNG